MTVVWEVLGNFALFTQCRRLHAAIAMSARVENGAAVSFNTSLVKASLVVRGSVMGSLPRCSGGCYT